MADKSMENITLKVMVNKETNKVIYTESENDFIDVLFSFLAIPMGTIISLSHRLQPLGISCMDNLYESVESLDLQLFRTEGCRAMLLRPHNSAEFLLENLKLKFDDCEPLRYFKCSNQSCYRFQNDFLSYYKIVCCLCGNLMDLETIVSGSGGNGKGVFVKGPARFIISDDLQVTPPFSSVSFSLVKKLGFMGWNTIEELTFNVGVDEVLNFLMCSFVSKAPLTEILLKQKPVPEPSLENLDQGIYTDSQMVGDTMNEEVDQEISIKLTISKSKKMVCYAEAGEDFVNLLFSFLTLPLGFIIKQMRGNSLKGCIDKLYESVQDLDEQYLMSSKHKQMLVSPSVPLKFGYENHPLRIREMVYYTCYNKPDMKSVQVVDPKSPYNEDDKAHGFLKGPAMFIITDTLNVSPISAILGLSILCKLNVPITDIEVRVARVGKEEAIHLLVAAFARDSALTSVFLKKPKKDGGLGCLSFLNI